MSPDITARIIDALSAFRCRVRIKEDGASPYPWSGPLFAPVVGYVETGASGPVSLRRLEWIEVEKKEEKHIGRLVPPKIIDRQREIEVALEKIGVVFLVSDEGIQIPSRAQQVSHSERP